MNHPPAAPAHKVVEAALICPYAKSASITDGRTHPPRTHLQILDKTRTCKKSTVNSKQGGGGFGLVPNIGTFLSKLFGYLRAISQAPGKEENHGPASRHHNDPGPTSTNLQEGPDPEGSYRVAALSPNALWGSRAP